jgi:RNase adaptor protein for sRNA GlmZ degradation
MLQLDIYSFSYHQTADRSADLKHGGGHEFDCRCLYNPGREPRFKYSTGLDPLVAEALRMDARTNIFLNFTLQIIEYSLNHYLERGFDYLAIGYGCTGGQHRSVFCANACALAFQARTTLKVKLSHKQLKRLEWVQDRTSSLEASE